LSQIRKLTVNVLVLAAIIVGPLIVLEGSSSMILFGASFLRKEASPPAEQRHTQYDRLLGWVNIPNLVVPNLYGPGVFLRTNARGFRGSRPIGPDVPDGKVRVICSGDSFTFGYGVDDDHTWCQLLATLDQRLDPVNMGQGGYGIDQSYLWYKRDGSILNHHIHIFAFITLDFFRMERAELVPGYSKPILDIDHGHLIVKNVPVPHRRWYAPWITRSVTALQHLRSYELAGRAIRRTRPPLAGDTAVHEHTWAVATKVFDSLEEVNEAKKSVLVLVYLPAKADYRSSTSEIWRRRLAAESKSRGWIYIDLVAEMQQLAPDQIEELFIPEGQIQFRNAGGHYTVAGNKWVAQTLYRRIVTWPGPSRILADGR
jgi:hypothetical protein